jgi:hypothetical protein
MPKHLMTYFQAFKMHKSITNEFFPHQQVIFDHVLDKMEEPRF